MKHIFLMVLLLGAVAIPGVAAAQNAETNSTVEKAAQAAQNATEEKAKNESKEMIERQIDPVTRVVSSEYSDGQFILVLEADVPQLVTLSGSVAVQEGWQTFATKSVRVPSNRRVTVKIAAEEDEGAATVSIATRQCRNAGQCPILSSGERSGASPFERTTSTAGWLGGASVAIAMVGAAAFQRRHKDWPAVEEAS